MSLTAEESLVFAAKMSNIQGTSSGPLASDNEQQIPVESASRYPSDAKDPKETVDDRSSADFPDENAQHGVKMVEAVTLSWTKKTLGMAYAT